MNFVFEIDRQRLLDGSTGAPVASLQFSYPDKYPVTISITRGNQPHPVTGNVYVTLKPASAPLSAPLALLTIPVNGSATATGILDTYIQEMDAWLPAANKRAAQFEILVVSTTGGTEVSVDVPAQVSRRYNSVDQPGVTVAEKSLATQAEAEAGTNNAKWMSPLRVAQAISHLAEFADTTDELSEGTTNKYFTTARAAAAAPVQSVAGKTGAVVLAAADITDFTIAVAAAAPAPTTPSNSGLSITGTAIATAYNTAIADTVVSVPVGGAPAAAASTWKSKNLVQVLDDILFPTILASVGSAKSLDLAVSGTSGTLEIGTSVSRTLTATFTRGTILNGNGSTNSNPLVGAATGYTFTGTGISSTSQASNTLSFTTPVVTGSNNWAVTATHDAGTGTYQDNKGVSGSNLDAPRAAGSLTDSTSSPAITGVHPYYYLKSASPITSASMVTAIGNGTATKVVASSTGTLSIPYAPTAEYFAVAYPSTSTTKTRYFVTALDNGAITVVFSPVATQTVTTTLWSQDYRIHVSTAALTNSNSTIELRNT